MTPGIYTASLLATNRGGALPVIFTLSVGQSSLQNGGFETGDFTDWTLVGNSTVGRGPQTIVYNAVESSSSGYTVAHSGNYGAFLGDTQPASLSQSVPTVAGQYYLVSLWLDNPVSGTVQQFTVNWIAGGATNTLYTVLNPAAFSWTNLQFLACANGTNATLQIQAENDPDYFGLDDVSVAPVPSPTFRSLASAGKSFQLSWISSTGLVYQVQFKTNLLQTNWTDLNKAFTATNYIASMLDTNALASSPRRFYRLILSP